MAKIFQDAYQEALEWARDHNFPEDTIAADAARVGPDEKLFGKCILTIFFKNHGEYLRWRKYVNDEPRWDFDHTYPAQMRAEYEFHTTRDVDILTRKIIELLQLGFNVRASQWQLEQYKSQLEG